ncbi:MAG TPA: hypothetical protein VLA14_07905 [Polyangia bacterium]|jgi:hypothetical protein|nr:hypothetical protein [Polyangia bacterium]
MDRIARLGGLPLIALVALGCGGSGGGGVKYVPPTINFDARAADAQADETLVTPSPGDASTDTAPGGPTDAADAVDTATNLGPCPYGGAVPIYCSGGSVYEPSPLIACIGGGHIYGTCPSGCATSMVMGPVADPLAVLCGPGADGDARDVGVDGQALDGAGAEQ